MEARLRALSKADDELMKQAILRSMVTEIENNEHLERKIGEIIPFLSDRDRVIRQQAIIVLGFFNSEFHVKILQKTISEMATIKLADAACLEASCGILMANIEYLDHDQINSVMSTLLQVDLRGNSYMQRIVAYKLFRKLLDKKPDIGELSVEQFKQFCGYEQDPRCLSIVFEFFPIFAKMILNKLNKAQRNELFDVIGVFFPISQRQDLANQLSKALVECSEFADDLAALVSLKLKNSLSDTRAPVYTALPILLVHQTSNEQIASVLDSFIISLKDHFDGGSKSVEENIANAAVDAISNFVKINQNCHSLIKQIGISEWIPKITQSEIATEIRAYSIVSWVIDKIVHLFDNVLPILSEAATEAMKNGDESRVQSVIASLVEYLKVQDPQIDKKRDDLLIFFNLAQSVLASNNRNLQITGIVFIREFSAHFYTPVSEELLQSILKIITYEPFVTQTLINLSHQPHYDELLTNQFTNPLIHSILSHSSFHDFQSPDSVIDFASKLTSSTKFSGPLFKAMAKVGDYRDLTKCILLQSTLDDEVSDSLLNTLSGSESVDTLVLAIALRSSDELIRKKLQSPITDKKHEELIFASANPSIIPLNYNLSTEKLNLLYSAKIDKYDTTLPNLHDFKPHILALAIRGEFTDDFKPDDIGKLLDFEDQFDGATGSIFDKFELISKKFIYNPNYKETLWNNWHARLSNHPGCFLDLCLLAPPEYFLRDIKTIIPAFPNFMKANLKRSLDLLIFALLNLNDELGEIFTLQLDSIIKELINALSSPDPHIRLDTARIFQLLTVSTYLDDISSYKPEVTRKLRKVLDDPKREVRQMASQANFYWIRLGADD